MLCSFCCQNYEQWINGKDEPAVIIIALKNYCHGKQ